MGSTISRKNWRLTARIVSLIGPPSSFPLLVPEAGSDHLLRKRVGGVLRLAASHLEHRPVAQAGEEQIVQPVQFGLMEGVPAVQNQIAGRSALTGEGAGADEGGRVVCGGVALCTQLPRIVCPADGQVGERLAYPEIAAGVAEEDQVAASAVLRRHRRIVLDGEFAPEVAAPFVGETAQVGVRPGLYPRVPGRAGAAHTEEWGGKGIVNRPLQARLLACQAYRRAISRHGPLHAPALQDDPVRALPWRKPWQVNLLAADGQACLRTL